MEKALINISLATELSCQAKFKIIKRVNEYKTNQKLTYYQI